MMNTKTYEFEAIIKKVLYIDFPYEGSLVRMNTPNHIIAIRKQINKQADLFVKVIIRERKQ